MLCVFENALEPLILLPSMTVSVALSLISLHPSSFSFVSPPYVPQIMTCVVICFPSTHCTLASCHSVLCLCLVACGRALTAPTPGLTLLTPPGVPDLCYAGTPTPAVI